MELLRALGALLESPSPEMAAGLAPVAEALELGQLPEPEAHSELFLFQLYPYASVYLSSEPGAEGMLGGEARDRIAGFWRALGRTPPAEPDHLGVLLAAAAELAAGEAAASADGDPAVERWRRARRTLLWEHLLPWLPVYLEALTARAPPFYRRWGELLADALAAEAAAVGLDRDEAPPLPLALRAAPPLADPRVDPGEPTGTQPTGTQPTAGQRLLRQLLAPAVSGMLLTRDDLARGARQLGSGLRAGERRYALEHLVAQQPAPTFGWLAGEARRWGERHRRRQEAGTVEAGRVGAVASAAGIAAWWQRRAEASAALLDRLAASVESEG